MPDTGTYLDDLPDSSKASAPPAWDEVKDSFAKAYPELDQEKMQSHYEIARNLTIHRKQAELEGGESAGEYISRRSVPFVSPIVNVGEDKLYSAAKDRMLQGKPSPGDYREIAKYEHRKEAEGKQNFWQSALSGLSRIPAIAGEALATGPEGVGAEAGASLGARAGIFAAKTAVQTPMMPSLYAPEASQRAVQQGGEWTDPKNLATPLSMGFAQNLVLGSLGGWTSGIKNPATRFVASVGAGMGAQAGVDIAAGEADRFLPEAYKTKTDYGLIGEIMEGKSGDALKHAVVQAVTFSVFTAMHGNKYEAKQTLSKVKELLDDQAAKKVPADQVAKDLARIVPKEEPMTAGKPGDLDATQPLRPVTPQGDVSKPPGGLPPLEPGMTRFYHGGGPYDGGKRWQGTAMEAPFNAFEAPEEIASRLKVVPKTPQTAPNAPQPPISAPKAPEAVPEPSWRERANALEAEHQKAWEAHEDAQRNLQAAQKDIVFKGGPERYKAAQKAAKEARITLNRTKRDLATARDEAFKEEAAAKPQESPTEAPISLPKGVNPELEESKAPTALERMQDEAMGPIKPPHVSDFSTNELLDRAEKAGVTGRQKEILQDRLIYGVSVRDLAEQHGVDEKTIRNEESRALSQAGVRGTADELHAANAPKALGLIEQLDKINAAAKMEVDRGERSGKVKLSREEVAQKKISDLAAEFLKKAKKGLTPEEEQAFHDKADSLNDELSGAERSRSEQTPVRSKNGRVVPGGPEASGTTPPGEATQAVATPQTGGNTEAIGQGDIGRPGAEAADALRGKAASDELDAAGMGAASPMHNIPPALPGAPGTSAPNPQQLPQGPMPTSGYWRKAANFIKSLSNQAFPAITGKSRESGEKLAEAANARAAAKSSWDYFSRILKVGDTPLYKMSPEILRELGATWLERRFRFYRSYLDSQGLDSSKVATLVGQPGSPLLDEAHFQENVKGLWAFFEQIKQEWTPEVEKNFRGVMGLDPQDAIDTKSQIPGLPINAIAMRPEDIGTPGVIRAGGGKDMRGVNISKPGFTREAGLDAPAYDIDLSHMMQRTLNTGIPAGRRAEFIRQAMKDGLIQGVGRGKKAPEGWQYTALDPARGLPDINPNARYYAHPDVFKEISAGLGIGDRMGSWREGVDLVKPVMNAFYNVALMSPVELATHVANHVTALARAGKGLPANLKGSLLNAGKLLSGDPEIYRRVMDLAKIGASFGHEARPGILGETLQKYDPTAYINKFTSKFIDVMQKAVRIQLEDVYNRGVDQGLIKDSETAKRDFINQHIGNYNSNSNNFLTQFLKETGLQSFATAAHTYTIQGIKASVPFAGTNAPATSWKASAQLRGRGFLNLLPFLAAGPVVNLLTNGQAFPSGVPAFAIKTGEDDKTVNYFDPLAFTGIRRGWRATGANALIEGQVQGMTSGEIADRAYKDYAMTAEHATAGPPVQAFHTFRTGENMLGHRVAEKPAPGESVVPGRAKAAVLGVNPLVGTFTQTDRPKRPRTFAENAFQSFGPFGVKTRTKK